MPLFAGTRLVYGIGLWKVDMFTPGYKDDFFCYGRHDVESAVLLVVEIILSVAQGKAIAMSIRQYGPKSFLYSMART